MNDVEWIQVIIENGGNEEVLYSGERTALELVEIWGIIEAYEYLLEQGFKQEKSSQ